MSYIEAHEEYVRHRHYPTTAARRNSYWFNLYYQKYESKRDKFADNFCLVINGAKNSDDAYVLPVKQFAEFFSNDFIDDHKRWTGYIRNGTLYVCVNGHSKGVSVQEYHNAFHLLAL